MQKAHISFFFREIRNCSKASERFRTRPDASECIRMHPNASEQVQTGQNTSENFEKLVKASKNFAKASNFCCETCEISSVTSTNTKATWIHRCSSKSSFKMGSLRNAQRPPAIPKGNWWRKKFRKFHEFARFFREVFRRFRKFFEVFGRVQTCSDLFGPVRMR